MSCQELLVDLFDEMLLKGSGAEEQAVVQGSVKKVDGGFDVQIIPERPFRDRRLHDLTNSFPSRVQPTIPESSRQLRV